MVVSDELELLEVDVEVRLVVSSDTAGNEVEVTTITLGVLLMVGVIVMMVEGGAAAGAFVVGALFAVVLGAADVLAAGAGCEVVGADWEAEEADDVTCELALVGCD